MYFELFLFSKVNFLFSFLWTCFFKKILNLILKILNNFLQHSYEKTRLCIKNNNLSNKKGLGVKFK